VKGLGAAQVARMLEVNVGQVYLIRHRLGKEVKRELDRLRHQPLGSYR